MAAPKSISKPVRRPASRAPGARTTLAGLARDLGLSQTTVSFVLNGQAEQRKIAPKTAERVLKAAADADYVPNGLARSLRQQRTHAIGVVFPHLRGDWAHRITQGVAEVMSRIGTVPLIVCHYGSGETELKLLHSLVERRVDGIICNPLADGFGRYQQVCDRGVPLVFLSDAPTGLESISLAASDPAAVTTAIDHLLELGHRRIAYLGVRDNRVVSEARFQAYRQALADAGVVVDEHDLVLVDPGEPFDDPVRDLLARNDAPTACFAVYDDVAVRVVELIEQQGLRCPLDVSVATIGGNVPLTNTGRHVTTVLCPVEQEGKAAAECLLEMIQHPKHEPLRRMVGGGVLQPGHTTGPRAS
ncbi:MAG: LacI family DNA-binding transcriptional regulator [Planctomycetota bacterium]